MQDFALSVAGSTPRKEEAGGCPVALQRPFRTRGRSHPHEVGAPRSVGRGTREAGSASV